MVDRVVFDTVIFVRGLMNPFGRWGRLVVDRGGEHRLVVSEPVLDECRGVIRRPKLVRTYRGLAAREVAAVLGLLEAADVVEIDAIAPVSRDPKDDPILAMALGGNAQYVVSEDNDLLVLGEYEGIQIVEAVAFLRVRDETGNGEAGA